MELTNKKILVIGANETIAWSRKNLAKYKVNVYNVEFKNMHPLFITEDEEQLGANNGI
jgi:hypothetical protein